MAVAGLVATVPAIRTRPAEINSTACSRERARPRRTSSASTLARRATSDLVYCCQGLNKNIVSPFENLCLLSERSNILDVATSIVQPFQQGVDAVVNIRRIDTATGSREVLAWKWY